MGINYITQRQQILANRPSKIGLIIFIFESVLFNLGWPIWINTGLFSLFCLTGLLLLIDTIAHKRHPAWIVLISGFLLLWITVKAYIAYEFTTPYFF